MKIIKKILFFILIFFVSCGSPIKINEEYQRTTSDIVNIDSINNTSNEMTFDSSIKPTVSETYRLKSISYITSDSVIVEKNLEKIGDIKHLIKDTMSYGKVDTVELVISYNASDVIIFENVRTFKNSQSNVKTQKIKITPVMKAKLIDPTKNSFKIIPITDSIQIVESYDNTYTLWQWRVIPLRGGNTELIMNVDMIVGDYKKSLKIYNDKIYVYINPLKKIENWFITNWKYITYILGLIGSIIAWLYKENIVNIFKKK